MENKNNSGAIFRNEKKEKPTSPDYSGSARIGDLEYTMSGWINKSREGKSYLRILFSPKPENKIQGNAPTVESFVNDDDLPF